MIFMHAREKEQRVITTRLYIYIYIQKKVKKSWDNIIFNPIQFLHVPITFGRGCHSFFFYHCNSSTCYIFVFSVFKISFMIVILKNIFMYDQLDLDIYLLKNMIDIYVQQKNIWQSCGCDYFLKCFLRNSVTKTCKNCFF